MPNKTIGCHVMQAWVADTGYKEVYLFYPEDEPYNGNWDEDKLTLSEALKKYPKSEYQWFLMD